MRHFCQFSTTVCHIIPKWRNLFSLKSFFPETFFSFESLAWLLHNNVHSSVRFSNFSRMIFSKVTSLKSHSFTSTSCIFRLPKESFLHLGNIPRPRNYWWKVSDPMKLVTIWEKPRDLRSCRCHFSVSFTIHLLFSVNPWENSIKQYPTTQIAHLQYLFRQLPKFNSAEKCHIFNLVRCMKIEPFFRFLLLSIHPLTFQSWFVHAWERRSNLHYYSGKNSSTAAASLAYLYLGDSSAHEAAAERQMMRRHEMWFPHHPPLPCPGGPHATLRRKRML